AAPLAPPPLNTTPIFGRSAAYKGASNTHKKREATIRRIIISTFYRVKIRVNINKFIKLTVSHILSDSMSENILNQWLYPFISA
ncbi:MAG: hypothetical protein ACRDC6_32195, partial [Shewanella sp.]